MVADRRITDLRTLSVACDQRNKATVFANQLAFAYSGLAELEGKRTDLWLAEVLAAGKGGLKGLYRVAERATQAFASLRLPREWSRHAFVAVGWAAEPAGNLVPVWISISNAVDQNGRWLPHAQPAFKVTMRQLTRGHHWTLCPPIGAILTPPEVASTHALIRPALKRAVRPVAAAILLGRAIQSVARREPSVGTSLLGVVIPRKATRLNEICFLAPQLRTTRGASDAMCFDLDPGAGHFQWVLPNYVMPGQIMTGGAVAGVDETVRSFELTVSKPKPGTRVGLGLRGSTKEVIFGIDALGEPFTEVRERRHQE
jgi:hypothetical protein